MSRRASVAELVKSTSLARVEHRAGSRRREEMIKSALGSVSIKGLKFRMSAHLPELLKLQDGRE